ncbi:MAG: DUF1700 domain-containing protein [Lachnospiraceae bacterium]|nr:DUF1700 domain-containing protein [Lachnospiraceae bacterium]
MTKQTFLDELRMALSGKLGSSQIESHARYYEEYINAEIRRGKTEEEVLRELGNPRLIARSIIDAENGNADYEEPDEQGYVHRKKINIPGWLIVLLLVLTVVAVLGIVVAVVWWLAPIILVIWLIVFLIKNIDKRQ